MYHDGVVAPHPPIARCLVDAVQAIEKAGHSTVPWNAALHQDLVTCINQLLSLDGQAEFIEALKTGNEPPTSLSKMILDNTNTKLLTIKDTWKASTLANHSICLGN